MPAAVYRARISCRGCRSGIGEIEGAEEYLLQLWPGPDAEPVAR